MNAVPWLRAARWLLWLLIASLAVMRPTLPVGPLAVVATDLLALAVAGCLGLGLVLQRQWPRGHAFFGLLAVYFCAMLASAIFSIAPLASFAPKLASQVYLLALPVMILTLIADRDDLRTAVRAWLWGTAAVAVIAVVGLALVAVDPTLPLLRTIRYTFGSLPLGPLARFRLTYENPNLLGNYLTASTLVLVAGWRMGWIGRGAALALLAGIVVAQTMTFSAGIGGIALGLGLWVWLERRGTVSGRLALAGAIAAGVAFAVAQCVTPVLYPNPPFALAVPGTGVTLLPSARMLAWLETVQTFRAHPWFGVGIGRDVAHVRFVEPSGVAVILREGHNVLLNLAAESGLSGAAAMLAIIVALWRAVLPFRLAGERRNLVRLAFGIGVLDCLVYQGIGGAFEDARFIWVLIGLLLAAGRLERAGALADGAVAAREQAADRVE